MTAGKDYPGLFFAVELLLMTPVFSATFSIGSGAAAIEFSIRVIPPPVGIPEPMTYGLVGLGLAVMVTARRRLEQVRRSTFRPNVDSGDRHPIC